MGFGFIIEVAIVWAGGVKSSCEVPQSSGEVEEVSHKSHKLRLRPLKPLVICYGGRIGVELLLGSHYPANPLYILAQGDWFKLFDRGFLRS